MNNVYQRYEIQSLPAIWRSVVLIFNVARHTKVFKYFITCYCGFSPLPLIFSLTLAGDGILLSISDTPIK